MLHPVFDQRDAVRMIARQQRVIGADLLDEAAIAGCGGFGDDDAVVGALFGSAPREPDFQGHACFP